MTTDARRPLWMLVDLEPGYDRLRVGDVIEGSAVWLEAGIDIQDSPIPGEILSTDVAAVVGDSAGPHCVLDLGALGSVLAGARGETGSAVRMSGTPMLDRYAWATSRLRSKVRGRIVRTGVLVRSHSSPGEPGWYDGAGLWDGPLRFRSVPPWERVQTFAPGRGACVEWYCVEIEPVDDATSSVHPAHEASDPR
ncbi:hypothetical protein RHDE110596_19140 [Prescottella defluvii]|uniref:hypothetical protein n=1 Tax=Prescottella defluvii TaxID=1323361 RepID=UPI0012E03BAA|nr:hypothetical protein [Prescottella defluvii]